MGSLKRFDLKKYADQYRLSVFFESGTFQGQGVERAIESRFEKIYSVEIVEEFYIACVKRFENFPNVTIMHGDSVSALERTLPEIDGNVLFWLDAHFPGADGGLADYNSEPDERIKYPLEFELETIKKLRPNSKDVFLIDDLRIYERGPFANGDLPRHIVRPTGNGVEFAYRLFADSHHILKRFEDEGYLLMLPIAQIPKIYFQ